MYDFKKIKNGDKKERNKVVVDNQGLVYNVARRYINADVEFDDLIQEGNIGLMRAIDLFDESKGIKFSTYAFYWIRTKIRRYVISDSKNIKYPVHIEEKIIDYHVYHDKFVMENGCEPSIHDMALGLGVDDDEVLKIMNFEFRSVSINSYIGVDKETSLEEVIDNGDEKPDDVYSKKELQGEFEAIFSSGFLSLHEVEVLKYRFGFNGDIMTLDEISKIYGVSRERIRQIEQRAIRKLRSSAFMDSLIDFADNSDRIKELRKKC